MSANSGQDSLSPLPSPITSVDIRTGTTSFPFLIPQRETWRIRQLLEKREYGGIPRGVLRTPPVILDVGANVGVFTVYAKLAYHPQAIVHCFEPFPPVFDLLQKNVSHFPAVAVHPFGLARADGEPDLFLAPDNTGANSIKPGHSSRPAGRVRIRVRDAGAVWDELGLDEVDVLKIDTEGCEVEVLEAFGPRLARVRVVLAEYHTAGDRRRIDGLLQHHVLFGSLIHDLRLGVVKYVRADLVGIADHD
jgi:FkbM family methyltransferase